MFVNQTFMNRNDGKIYRIVYFDLITIGLHDIDDLENCSIKTIKYQDFLEAIENNNYYEIPDPHRTPAMKEFYASVSDEVKKQAKLDYEIVSDIYLKDINLLLERKSRNRLIRERAKESGMKVRTLKRRLSRFLSGGMTVSALYKNYKTVVNMTKKTYTVRPGKKGKTSIPAIQFKNIFKKYYKRDYLHSNKSIRTVFTTILTEKFTDENGKLLPEELLPTYEDFWSFVRKQDKKKEKVCRTSTAHYLNNDAPSMGSMDQDIQFPLERVEIDNTVADFYVVSELNRKQTVGRPLITIVKDSKTHMILGVNVTLENASYEGASLAAIINVAEDKTNFCKKYGLNIKEEDWPVKGFLPKTIIGDKGELFSDYATSLAAECGVELRNAATMRARQKANVEHEFRPVNEYFKENFEGAIIKDLDARERPDYRKKARLTLKEFTCELLDFLITKNKNLIDNFTPIPEYAAHGIPSVPLEMYNYGMRFTFGSIIKADPDDIRIRLLPKATRVLSKDGITFNKIHYVPGNEETRDFVNQLLNNKRTRSIKIDFLYSTMDNTQILLLYKGKRIPFVLDEKQRAIKNITRSEADMLFESIKHEQEDRKRIKTQNMIDLEQRRKARSENSELNFSGSVETKNIKEHRNEEKLRNREPVFENLNEKELKLNQIREVTLDEKYSEDELIYIKAMQEAGFDISDL